MTDAGPSRGTTTALPAWGIDATAFNASPRRRPITLGLSALARWTPAPMPGLRGRLRPQVPVAQPLPALPLVDQRHGRAHEQHAGRRERLRRAGRPGPRGGPHPERHRRLARPGPGALGGEGHRLLHPRRCYIDARRCDFGQCSAGNEAATSGFVLLQYANHRARLYGLDLSTRLRLAESGGWGRLTAEGSLASRPGRRPHHRRRPLRRHAAERAARAGAPPGDLAHRRRGRGRSRTSATSPGSGTRSRPAATWCWNLRSSYEWRMLRLDVGVENLLDCLYSNPMGAPTSARAPR